MKELTNWLIFILIIVLPAFQKKILPGSIGFGERRFGLEYREGTLVHLDIRQRPPDHLAQLINIVFCLLPRR